MRNLKKRENSQKQHKSGFKNKNGLKTAKSRYKKRVFLTKQTFFQQRACHSKTERVFSNPRYFFLKTVPVSRALSTLRKICALKQGRHLRFGRVMIG